MNKITAALIIPIFLFLHYAPAFGKTDARVSVQTILAAHGAKFTDKRLSGLTKELQSVFKYSSYRLLSSNNLKIQMKKTGSVSLPGNRLMKITPMNASGGRLQLRMEISKNNRKIFNTVIRLLNRGSIIVGGPKYEGGYLLFHISGSF